MDILQKIGLAVKAARSASGVSQEELAHRLDKSIKTISNIERGAVSASIETLYLIAKELKVPMSDLLVDVEAKRSSKRYSAEVKGRELLRSLNDKDLEMAIAQIEVISNRR